MKNVNISVSLLNHIQNLRKDYLRRRLDSGVNTGVFTRNLANRIKKMGVNSPLPTNWNSFNPRGYIREIHEIGVLKRLLRRHLAVRGYIRSVPQLVKLLRRASERTYRPNGAGAQKLFEKYKYPKGGSAPLKSKKRHSKYSKSAKRGKTASA